MKESDTGRTGPAGYLADRVKDALGTVDGLFINAVVTRPTPFGSTTEKEYDELFDINVKRTRRRGRDARRTCASGALP
ncbi:hypothetical protein [Streptomyces okerensis]|uniref:hypothetical protein n=1 Tax=Streptomyces okerensis TaxID=3344655 RepID=UPI0038909574